MAALILSLVFVLGLGIWRISLPPARNAGGVSQASPMSASSLAKPVPRLSIVVLPFANLSNDAEQQYFVDAITDDLTSNLSRIVNSFVIARTTAFTYQGKAVDIKQLGRDLGVRYVLQGSARRAGEQVEVDVQLIDAESGTNVWTDRFDTSRTDLTNAEDEFTARLARALELQLVEAVGRRIERDSPANLDAHDLIMHGWAYYNRPQSMENLKLADDAFERALAMDPSSVDARVGIARVLGELLATGITKLPAERSAQIARAEDVLHHTLEHDRNNAEAHADLGRIRRIEGKLNESQIELEKSLELDRNQELAIIQSGITALLLGKPSVALPYFEKFRQINPQSQNSFFIYYWLGESHLMLSEATEAIDLLRKGHSANPDFLWAKFMLAASLGFNGNIDEAKSMFEAFRKQRQDLASFRSLDASSINWNTAPDFVALRQKTIDVGLRRAGMPEE
jgi:adenylate cyclase